MQPCELGVLLGICLHHRNICTSGLALQKVQPLQRQIFGVSSSLMWNTAHSLSWARRCVSCARTCNEKGIMMLCGTWGPSRGPPVCWFPDSGHTFIISASPLLWDTTHWWVAYLDSPQYIPRVIAREGTGSGESCMTTLISLESLSDVHWS